eukprot:COSAG02_NODE_40042_length_409_cov_2.503226_1_plen_68_part_01
MATNVVGRVDRRVRPQLPVHESPLMAPRAQDWVLETSDPRSWAPLNSVPDAAQLMERARLLQAAARAE